MINRKLTIIFILALTVMNILYFSFEIYKYNIRESWLSNDVTESEAFNELSRLGTWTSLIEILISLSIIVTAFWIYKKRRRKLTIFIYINSAMFAVFTGLGLLTAYIFDIAAGNLVQQQTGPLVIIIFLIVYQIGSIFYYRLCYCSLLISIAFGGRLPSGLSSYENTR